VSRALVGLLLLGSGCFGARGGAERFHDRVLVGMDQSEVRKELGKPREIVPIPGQADSAELPVEQWRFSWTYRTGKMLTAFLTLGIGAIFTDWDPYGFDVAFGRDGRVRVVSEVGPRP